MVCEFAQGINVGDLAEEFRTRKVTPLEPLLGEILVQARQKCSPYNGTRQRE